jgi:RsiW-degrading membrane proteinase PrsW (M82 family)
MDSLSTYLLLIILGMLPSLIWLGYWLRKDAHPEPKILVAKVLLLGIILSPLAIVLQLVFVQLAARILSVDADSLSGGPGFYLWAAFVEEIVKYLAVYFVVLRSPEFDEPVDAMVYMLTAALESAR